MIGGSESKPVPVLPVINHDRNYGGPSAPRITWFGVSAKPGNELPGYKAAVSVRLVGNILSLVFK